MGAKDKRIAVLTGNYFDEAEMAMIIKILRGKANEVTIISADKKELQSISGVGRGKTFKADLLLDDTDFTSYEVLVLPGGILNALKLRINEKVKAEAIKFVDRGKLLAVSGYSTLLLVSADLIEEKKLTSPREIEDDIKNAGGEWTNRAVVVDGNLITSSGSTNTEGLANRVIERLS